MRKIAFVFLLVICSIPSILLADKVQIEQGQHEEIYFELENKNSEPLYYTIYSVGGFQSIIFYYSQILLQPGEHKYIKVIIFLSNELKPGSYKIELTAESRLDRITKNLEIELIEKEKEINVKEFLFNNKLIKIVFNILDKYNLEVEIQKEGKILQVFEKEITPEDNQFEKNLDLELGDYLAKVKVYRDNNLLYTKEKTFTRHSKITQEKQDWDYFIAYGSRIKFHNEGDSSEREDFVLYVDKSQDPFFSSIGYTSKVDVGNQYKYVWEFTLLPNQSHTISYSFNYSIILILIIAILFLMSTLYFVTKKEIKLTKSFMKKVNEISEGKEIRICIEVVNKAREEITDITVEDYVPPIFSLKKEFSVVKPKKIVDLKKDKKIVWEIPRIEPKETRVFTYKIVPKVGVKGSYSFPLAKLKYKKNKLIKIVLSNSLKIK
jgi:hypothetical protein